MMLVCNFIVFNFYNYLRIYFFLLRRYFGLLSEIFLIYMILVGKSGLVGIINLSERRLFFIIVSVYLKVGCLMLVLEVLLKMFKVSKKVKSCCRGFSFLISKDFLLKLDVREDKCCVVDWLLSLINGFEFFLEGFLERYLYFIFFFDWS